MSQWDLFYGCGAGRGSAAGGDSALKPAQEEERKTFYTEFTESTEGTEKRH